MKPKILLALSAVHGISELIEQNLKFCGFDVINISRNDKENDQFKYPSLFANLKVKIQKLLGQKDAKKNLQSKLLLDELKTIMPLEGVDYALIFLVNNYSTEFLNFVRYHSQLMVSYHWDGLNRFPSIFERIKFFDRFFVFDRSDFKKSKAVLPATSFYFDYDLDPLEPEFDFYYLGAHSSDKIELLIKFANFINKQNFTTNINVVLPKRRPEFAKLYPKNVNILQPNQVLDFKENLLLARKSKILLDFVLNDHKGLSLRIFEALGHNKKLITTNADIVNYDFYHPNNIFVLNENNIDKLNDFLNTEFIPIDPKIKLKYGFSNWIKYVLNISSHQKISLPK